MEGTTNKKGISHSDHGIIDKEGRLYRQRRTRTK